MQRGSFLLALIAILACHSGTPAVTGADANGPHVKSCQRICHDDTECPDGRPCVNGTCVLCRTNADCDAITKKEGFPIPFAGGCEPSTGICKLCSTDEHCWPMFDGGTVKLSTGRCDVASGSCIGCTDDSECVPSPRGLDYKHCSRGACVTCIQDSDCSDVTFGWSGCNTTTGLCTHCTKDSECCGSNPACGLKCEDGVCACSADEQCPTGYSPPLVCK